MFIEGFFNTSNNTQIGDTVVVKLAESNSPYYVIESNIHNDVVELIEGYVVTDINGDLFVDVADEIISYNNSNNVVTIIRP